MDVQQHPQNTSVQEIEEINTIEITGTFVNEDGTPASGVRISIIEKDKNGKKMNYDAVATATRGAVELIFQCPGTAVTDENGILNCSVNLNKFVTEEKRFTLIAQYQDPSNPNQMKIPSLSPEKNDSMLTLSFENGNFNLDNMVGKIIVSGI